MICNGSRAPAPGDTDRILARRHDNSGDYWATPDGRLYVGSPFSTIGALLMLHELGLSPHHEAIRGGIDLIWRAWRDDGRIPLSGSAPLYPCYTAEAVDTLQSKLDTSGQLVVERPHRALRDFDFCRRGDPSALATARYQEIVRNVQPIRPPNT
jgi:hypothetical protein